MTRIERSMAMLRWAMVVAAGVVAVYSIVEYGLPDDATTSDADARYYCPMHPQIRSHDEGTCPICHMQLEPIPTEDDAPETTSAAPLPDGFAPVTVTLERQQQFGIETAEAVEREIHAEQRFPAVIEARPSALVEVRTRVPAFIERIVVDRVGVRVRRGQVLATAFSPDVARMGDELALSQQLGPEFGGALAEGTRAGLVRAGVDPAGSAAGSADRRGRFSITAPRAGFLTRVAIPVGAFATPDVVLFELADLDRVLAVASLDESTALGDPASLHARFVTDRGTTHDASLDSAESTIDPATRIRRARFAIANPDSVLLPGSIGTLVVDSGAATRVVVPADAVLDDGVRRIVFVDRGEGRFEPREVVTAGRDRDAVGIREGLRAGERVVVRGGFLIDSESRLSAATRSAPSSATTPRDDADAGAAR